MSLKFWMKFNALSTYVDNLINFFVYAITSLMPLSIGLSFWKVAKCGVGSYSGASKSFQYLFSCHCRQIEKDRYFYLWPRWDRCVADGWQLPSSKSTWASTFWNHHQNNDKVWRFFLWLVFLSQFSYCIFFYRKVKFGRGLPYEYKKMQYDYIYLKD